MRARLAIVTLFFCILFVSGCATAKSHIIYQDTNGLRWYFDVGQTKGWEVWRQVAVDGNVSIVSLYLPTFEDMISYCPEFIIIMGHCEHNNETWGLFPKEQGTKFLVGMQLSNNTGVNSNGTLQG
jgi:hypothetical protein